MSKALIANTTVTFRHADSLGLDIRLEHDSKRPVESVTYHTSPRRVTATNKTYVRLYHGANVSPRVTPVTGDIVEAGTDIARGVVETYTVTPDSMEVTVPAWATNVVVRVLGRSFGITGAPVVLSLRYDSEKRQIVVSEPAFAAIEAVFDAPYRLFLYTFTGTCPVNPPARYDNTGNEVTALETPNFADGVIFANDFTKNAYATLTLAGPECTWAGSGVSGTESQRTLPKLAMDIHPDYPIRLVSGDDGGRAWCECTVRVFPAGTGAAIYATSGSSTFAPGVAYMAMKDVLIFENESSQSLRYTPVGSVELTTEVLYPIEDTRRRFSDARSTSVLGPGETITDVDYSDDGRSYSNPRQRTLEVDEICLVDAFRTPIPSLAVVTATYATSYDSVVFYFDWDPYNLKWGESILLARAPDGRSARLELAPPTTKARNRKFENE